MEFLINKLLGIENAELYRLGVYSEAVTQLESVIIDKTMLWSERPYESHKKQWAITNLDQVTHRIEDIRNGVKLLTEPEPTESLNVVLLYTIRICKDLLAIEEEKIERFDWLINLYTNGVQGTNYQGTNRLESCLRGKEIYYLVYLLNLNHILQEHHLCRLQHL